MAFTAEKSQMENDALEDKDPNEPAVDSGVGSAVDQASVVDAEKKEEKPAGAECGECRPWLSRCTEAIRKWLRRGQAS